jgi:DNA-binding beta-propeller fold protein YncE
MNCTMRSGRSLALAAGVLAAALLAACASDRAASPGRAGYASSGAILVTVDDGDLGPRLYVDGVGEPRNEGAKDTVTVVRLPLPDPGDAGARVEWSQSLAPNSAAGAYGTLSVSPDGRLAAVASTGASVESPEPGRVTLIDLRAEGVTGATRVLGAIDGPPGLCAVAFRPDGRSLAMLSPDGALAFVTVSADGFGAVITADAARAIGDEWTSGARATGLAWSPAGDRMALSVAGADALAVLAVDMGEQGVVLRSTGAPARTRANPASPAWTPDGRLVVVSERAVPLFMQGVVQRSASGTLGLFRTEAGAAPARCGEVRLDRGVDAFALSPDGAMILVAARRPGDEIDRGERLGGTLSLVALDAKAGAGRVVATARCSSFPTGVAFDPAGRTALVCDFLNNEAQVWRVQNGSRPSIEYTGVNVGVGAGPHAIAVAR